MKIKYQKSNIKNTKQNSKSKVVYFFITCLLVLSLTGCDAFVRKFTRKPKREAPKEEFVLAPEEYKAPQATKEELYRQYFLFWKSWQDELINSLSIDTNHKKQIYCVNEIIKNLEQMRILLNEMKQKELDIYISQIKELKDSLMEDLYGNIISKNRLTAERVKRGILRDFSYKKIKEFLK